MRRLKGMADDIIASQEQIGRCAEPPPPMPFFAPRLSHATLSLDCFPIVALEETDSRCGAETCTSCVSFPEGISADDCQNSSSTLLS
jgi:hypothetical protein